jgi:Cyclin
MPQQPNAQKRIVKGPENTTKGQASSSHRQQQSSEGTLLMSDSEDPFMDSPASVSAETNMSSSRKTSGAKNQAEDDGAAIHRQSGAAIRSDVSNSDRENYTTMVRNKYFDSQNATPDYKRYCNDTSLEDAKNMDFSEIFESERFEATPPSGPGDHRNSRTGNDLNDADWINGPDREEMSRTPPLTLYASNYSDAVTPRNEGADTRESAGFMSPLPSEIMDGMSLGRNTPTSQFSENAVAGSVSSSIASSVVRSSVGSVNQPSSLLMKQPVLYSAIGSLEQVNTGSLRNLNERLHAPSKDFWKLGADQQSTLIPPLNYRKSLLAAVSNTEIQAQQKDTPLNVDHASSKDRSSSSIGTAHIKKSNNVNGEEVFGVLKKRSSKDRKKKEESGSTNGSASTSKKKNQNKKVTYDPNVKSKKKNKGPIEMFRPSSDAYTPRIERKSIQYRAAEARTPVQRMASPMGTLQKPNFRDALRRVAMIIHQHIVKIEGRFEGQSDTKLVSDDGLFKASMKDMFNEDTYRTPTYKCTMVRIPMARPGMAYGLRKIRVAYEIPSETEIYEFGHQLFKSVQLSSECSIVCLIYVERLMEHAKVPLLACTWRPIFMCGLLLASKVWQDLSSWNIEFASVYPQFSLEAINRLELNFLRNVKWDLYISSR